MAAIDAANFKGAFDDPDLKGTVFAPSETAFAALIEALGVTPEELLANKALLRKVNWFCACAPARAAPRLRPPATTARRSLFSPPMSCRVQVLKNHAVHGAPVKSSMIGSSKTVVHSWLGQALAVRSVPLPLLQACGRSANLSAPLTPRRAPAVYVRRSGSAPRAASPCSSARALVARPRW